MHLSTFKCSWVFILTNKILIKKIRILKELKWMFVIIILITNIFSKDLLENIKWVVSKIDG